MYIAINKKNPNEIHSFTWSVDSKLTVNNEIVNADDWDIVEVEIISAPKTKPLKEPRIVNVNPLINIFINGNWDADHKDETCVSPVRIFDKGTHIQILASQYNQYIDDLEDKGFDCYFSPEMYMHPQWNGEIIYM